ncbi:replication protein A 70 kDa DNA-binding subunit B-like protein [Arabidopsis thaliana]|uniref:Replication protein A 70 kDa DNA-binding subunit B-like protein n=1 Tax=Arabidopsis thaliana TaxID=3702 RepID=A0A1I9LMB0_ARATH|nr:replication protein A 70 kDa DNA-binding subunit B-like protein [Arabidopsis thaliana]ANM63718.1 replication protein A 70 kDa DNA-binding subunit B-like protein [Arabidopsis thaliana]|eukprot:NP_001325790.1 replication protein A 70 kDa DNA-binding subunit B-like protein [Arabidopsis thaliana]
MAFVNHTFVSACVSISDDAYLSLPKFQSIIVGELNPFYLVGENQFTNAFDASVFVINPDLPKDGLELTIAETKPKLELSAHICKIMCTIFKIDGDMGWFYVGWKKCNKKVEMNKNNDTTIAVKLKKSLPSRVLNATLT